MIIVADERIPGIEMALGESCDVRLLPGHAITSRDLQDAVALFVRSVTRVNSELLTGSNVRFVGSATAGVDHINVENLSESGITVCHAPGCNAPAVCDYVLTALFELGARFGRDPFDLTVGIIGVGNVGGRLAQRLGALGINTVLNDPPLEAKAKRAAEATAADSSQSNRFTSLPELIEQSDIITLHVPLSDNGPYPTRGLIGSAEIDALAPSTWLFNTSRGFVVDESSLLSGLEADQLSAAVVDTWQDEPSPNCDLVRSVSIATPHIGAYATQSKTRATKMIVQAFSDWAGHASPAESATKPRLLPLAIPPSDLSDAEFCVSMIRQAYDIQRDHIRMQAMCSFSGDRKAAFFRELRDDYRFRSEFASFSAPADLLTPRRKQLVLGLGMNVAPVG